MCGARHAHWQIPDGIVARRGFKTTRVKRVVLGENRIETLPGRIIQSRHITLAFALRLAAKWGLMAQMSKV